jgi:sulfur-carrier protein
LISAYLVEAKPYQRNRSMPTVTFTPALRRFLRAEAMRVEGVTVRAALTAVFAQNPALRGYLLDDQGALRRHVVVYLQGAVVRDLDDAVGTDGEIYVFQALTGG